MSTNTTNSNVDKDQQQPEETERFPEMPEELIKKDETDDLKPEKESEKNSK